MNILVLYNSRTGHTRATAEAIGRAARREHHQAIVKSVVEVGPQDVAEADTLFIGTWVQGLIIFGVRPAGADMWVSTLPSLDDKPVATFCTYAFNPRGSLNKLGALLSARGALIIAQRAFHRTRNEEGVDEFFNHVLDMVEAKAA